MSSSQGPGRSRLFAFGLLAGLCVNVVDIPNSAILVSPGWSRLGGAVGAAVLDRGVGGAR
jgi:hypothetical protein